LCNVLIGKEFCTADHPIKGLVGDEFGEHALFDAKNRRRLVHCVEFQHVPVMLFVSYETKSGPAGSSRRRRRL
jgi:hypothetical protein